MLVVNTHGFFEKWLHNKWFDTLLGIVDKTYAGYPGDLWTAGDYIVQLLGDFIPGETGSGRTSFQTKEMLSQECKERMKKRRNVSS